MEKKPCAALDHLVRSDDVRSTQSTAFTAEHVFLRPSCMTHDV